MASVEAQSFPTGQTTSITLKRRGPAAYDGRGDVLVPAR